MNVISEQRNEASGYIEYHLIRIGTWDLFEDLARFFEKKYGAEPQVKNDGIMTREWQFWCDGEYFIFKHHEDIGNWFYSCSEKGDSELMRTIATDLQYRLGKEE